MRTRAVNCPSVAASSDRNWEMGVSRNGAFDLCTIHTKEFANANYLELPVTRPGAFWKLFRNKMRGLT
jgi:hypothetical protein